MTIIQMSIDVIIPTYKPDRGFIELIGRLKRQSIPPDKIIVVNTCKEYWEEFLDKEDHAGLLDEIELHHIRKQEFDHGRTRAEAMDSSKADICIMMTMDAMPADEYLIEQLIKPFADEDTAAVYARQLAYDDSSYIEKLTRSFNYPDESSVKSLEDLNRLQIKTFFCSNVCCAYNKKIYDSLGGFVRHTIFNEDMIYAAKAVRSGYRIAYNSQALVYHSHEYNGIQQFRRNFDNGVSHAQYPETFDGVGQEGEGLKMVKTVFKELIVTGHIYEAVRYIWLSGCKYIGFKLGCRYDRLPKAWVRCFTSNKDYFE